MAKKFSEFKKKELNEYFEMEGYYSFWGWIVPPKNDAKTNVDGTNRMNANGKRGSGVLYVPHSEQRRSSTNYTHTKLMRLGLEEPGNYYDPAFKNQWIRFLVEEGTLKLQTNLPLNMKLLKEGLTAIDKLCNRKVASDVEADIRNTFGDLAEVRNFDSIRLSMSSLYSFRANSINGLIEQIKDEIEDKSRLIGLNEQFNTLNLIAPLSENKQVLQNIRNSKATADELLESLDEILSISLLLTEADDEMTTDTLEAPPDITDTEPEEPKPVEEPLPNTPEEPKPEVNNKLKTIKQLEKKLAEQSLPDDDVKFKLIANLKEILPAIKNKTERSAVEFLLVNFIDTESIDNSIVSTHVNEFASLGAKIMQALLSLNDEMESAKSLLTVELKQMNSESTEINESVIDEAKKKKSSKSSKKKKKEPVGITPKLEVLLRLGLVPKDLFSRAKKALNAKKETGSIAMYRNLIFDILDEVVSYIEKDPTLYNRLRINVMKEMKKTYPTKQLVLNAYEEGKRCKMESAEMPSEYESDYILKSAWTRGFNEEVGETINKIEDLN